MRAFLLSLGLLALPHATAAQQAALVADEVRVENNNRLVAEGDVQISYEGSILTASRVTYDQTTDRVSVVGPLTLTDAEGTTVLAESAELDKDLTDGILQSARLVLDRRLQLAATEIARVGDRYTQLSNTVASACEVCSANSTPLWEIRARRVIYDQQEELIYFDRASFRLGGVPIAYIPRLRLPSPENERQSGLLTPQITSSSTLGFGIKLPYFQTLGAYADVTLTPYISAETVTLEALYRQNFSAGSIVIEGAYSQDTLVPDDRWFIDAEGAFLLPRDFLLEFDLNAVSDDRYLAQYGYAFLTRLESELRVSRHDRDTAFRSAFTTYHPITTREARIEDMLPGRSTDFAFEQRFTAIGGELRFGIDASGVQRDSDEDALGRDVSEIGTSLDYLTRTVVGPGLVWSNRAFVSGGTYRVADDAAFDDLFRVAAAVSTELRLPLQRTGPDGTHHLIEPTVQLAWSEADDNVPNEDSVLVDFDEGNLFALNRFPGDDRVEEGTRATLGLSYTARLPDASRVGLTLGRVLRHEADDDFNEGSGLSGKTSDWLAAVDLELGKLDFATRMLVDDSLDATRTEALASYTGDRFGLGGSYLFLDAEPEENRPSDTHEVTLNGNVRLARHWRAQASGRYDIGNEGLDQARLGLTYRTECIRVDLGASKTLYPNLDLDPVTSYAFEVELLGFGAGSVDESYRSTCRG